ncbi:type I restriction endonuclease subunit S [Salmonella enterica subsp. enterica serovar Seattle]|uniref:restriction endonuclease subunit S n=1 Tax=Salmonella enterica TaxID=28901 RepID=UPI0012F1D48B|nr:restriction endonuclease subunit S [Salmonella enterica]EBU8871137.1 type I restriction endonuclease subunit S [Salmonella enterica subsp. enterica serovar Seattle]EDW4488588.1 type I restriction endonuclease subunit S [Salmonella enterica subsp. enterica]
MSGGKLPEGWVDTQLGNIIELKYGKSLAAQTRDGFGFPVYGSNGVVGKHSIPLINKSGLIVGRKGSYGVVNKSVGPFFPIDTTYYIDDFYNQPLEFLFYYLSFLPLTKLNRSTAIPGLNRDDAYDLNIALPPLAEQKIIAEKLDTLLAQVDSTKARLEQIPQILKRFRQAVLSAAVSGKLTLGWRENNGVSESAKELLIRWTNSREQKFTKTQKTLLASNKIKKIKTFPAPTPADMVTGGKLIIPINWEIVSVSQIADCLDSQRVPVKKEYRTTSEGIYPYFGANGEVDRVDNFIFDGDFVLVTEDETFYGRIKPIAYRFTGKCWVNNHVHILSAPTKAANDYLCYALMYYKIIPWLTGTTGRAKLTQGALNSLPIGLPPEEEINEIVRRVEQLFAYADTIEKQVNSALTRVNSLTQSILAKAFRGELTAQWRAENPDLISGENSAAALLEKIKAERAASGGKKNSRKKS